MAIHLTPTELAREAGMHRQEVIVKHAARGADLPGAGSTRRYPLVE